ncbi:MAG: hypothetical protein COA79_20340 [Planctomycetota bacterium]|nr:MAG: hypothetical protein COA79_20340 [Planctomycetota bacterium]
MALPRIKLATQTSTATKPGGTPTPVIIKPITVRTTIKMPTKVEIIKTADQLGVTPDTVVDSIDNVLKNDPIAPKGGPAPRPIETTREMHDAVVENIEDSKAAPEDKGATVLPDDLLWGMNKNYVYAGGVALMLIGVFALAKYTNIFK